MWNSIQNSIIISNFKLNLFYSKYYNYYSYGIASGCNALIRRYEHFPLSTHGTEPNQNVLLQGKGGSFTEDVSTT